MKTLDYVKAAVAAAALLGTATFAAPRHAITLSAASKAAVQSAVATPTADEKAAVALLEKVSPGATQQLVAAFKSAPDTASLATTLETLTATNPSLLAAIEEVVAAIVADARLAKLVGGTACASDAANIHSMVRIWCGLPALDPYPVVP